MLKRTLWVAVVATFTLAGYLATGSLTCKAGTPCPGLMCQRTTECFPCSCSIPTGEQYGTCR